MSIGVFDIDEDLDDYFQTLDDNDRNWSLKEEINAREILGMNILTDEALKNLQKPTQDKSHMKGTHCYDILANELYCYDFQYFSPGLNDRSMFIQGEDIDNSYLGAQSDLVKVALNLAFLCKEKSANFVFTKEYIIKLMMENQVKPKIINQDNTIESAKKITWSFGVAKKTAIN